MEADTPSRLATAPTFRDSPNLPACPSVFARPLAEVGWEFEVPLRNDVSQRGPVGADGCCSLSISGERQIGLCLEVEACEFPPGKLGESGGCDHRGIVG